MSKVIYGTDFLTGTRYYGESDAMGMQGYGMYVYPDNTRYIGTFRNGKFHGKGHFEFPHPVNMHFLVVYDHGKLLSIRNVCFDDNLDVEVRFNKNEAFFENWKYCDGKDRRFFSEVQDQLQPVGPTTLQTANSSKPVQLNRNIFDLGFGYLNQTGFLYGQPSHHGYNLAHYVGCRSTRKWIRENCRHGPLIGKQLKREFMAQCAREIIDRNLKANQRNKCQENTLPKNEYRLSQICRSTSSASSSSESRGRTLIHLGELTSETTDSCGKELEVPQKNINVSCNQDQFRLDNFSYTTLNLESDSTLTAKHHFDDCQIQ